VVRPCRRWGQRRNQEAFAELVIWHWVAAPMPPWIDAWLQGLRDNGYEEGRNLKIEWALAAGKRELLPAMAADLVQKNVEVIVAATSLGGVAAKKATRTIPIVVLARCSIVKAQRTYGPRALAEHLGTARTPLVC
jgi:hypothetical protein